MLINYLIQHVAAPYLRQYVHSVQRLLLNRSYRKDSLPTLSYSILFPTELGIVDIVR